MEFLLPFKDCTVVEELSGGSKRRFFRVRCKDDVFVVMQCMKEEDVENYIRIRNKLQKVDVHIPYMFEVKGKFLLLEDLGNLSLYRYIKLYGADFEIYKRVIEELIKLQKSSIDGLPLFGEDKLYREYLHFKKYYVPYANIDTSFWEEKVRFLVEICSKVFYVPMHRDFQSTNIFIKNKEIYLIDFQDMHKGPLYFDISSLLFDPYIMLQESAIWELVEYYKKISGFEFEKTSFLACGILRMMQALGAFVRLSMDGKEFFRGFIRKAKCRLRILLSDIGLDDMVETL